MRRPFLLLFFCALSLGLFARAEITVPALTSEFVDGAGIVDSAARSRIRSAIAQLNERKNIQLAIATLDTLDGQSIEQVALAYAEKWRLGKKGEDRGVILLIAPKDRRMRFEVGYGLEGELSDIVTKRILSDVIAPEFRESRYEQGILASVQAVTDILNGEWKPAPRERKKSSLPAGTLFFIIAFIFLMFILQGIPAASGRRGRGRDDFWGGGGGFGGGGFGGGGFGGGGGGFSGGGGGFGGGGSSSSW